MCKHLGELRNMTRSARIILAALVILLLASLALMLVLFNNTRRIAPAIDVIYEGKGLSVWLNGLNGWDYATDRPAVMALRKMGTNAVPALIRIITKPGSPQRTVAWNGLIALGSNAISALSFLTDAVLTNRTEVAPAIALANVGPSGVPVLLKALTNADKTIRYNAAFALDWERSDSARVVPALIVALKDPEPTVRGAAADALGDIDGEVELRRKALNSALSTDSVIRLQVTRALANLPGKDNQSSNPTNHSR
jgi:hypothetical protein